MFIKIKLPNPESFSLDYRNYFDQLELAVYHARKSYEKIADSVSPEKSDNILLWIGMEGIDGADELEKSLQEAKDSKDSNADDRIINLMRELEINISY